MQSRSYKKMGCALLFTLANLITLTASAAMDDGTEEDSGSSQVETSFSSGSSDSSSVWGFGVAPRVGLDIPTSKLKPFVVAALELDLFFPVLDGKLAAALDFSFTYPRMTESINEPGVGGSYEYTTKVLQLKFALDVIYRFLDKTHNVVPFVGAGVVLQYLRTTQSGDPDFGQNEEKNAQLGFEILGGVDFTLGPGALFADVRFVFSRLDHEITGQTNAGNITICGGYRFIF